MEFDLDQLRAFVAFAEALNFTHAARTLGISQPALHVKIRKLGEAMGLVLYVRRGRTLELTADGVRVLAFARELLERKARFVAELSGGAGGPVVVAAGEGTWLYWLGRLLLDPPHPVAVVVRDGPGTLAAVRAGEAHVGVVSLDALPEDLEAVPVATVPMVLAMPAGHVLAKAAAVGLEDLAGEPLVAPPAGGPLRRTLESEVPDLRVAAEARGWPLTLRFVQLGLGVAVVNGFCALPDGVVARPLPELVPRRYVAVRRLAASDAERTVWEAVRALG
jgi:DNA-binding transcriptional LysR family regulator